MERLRNMIQLYAKKKGEFIDGALVDIILHVDYKRRVANTFHALLKKKNHDGTFFGSIGFMLSLFGIILLVVLLLTDFTGEMVIAALAVIGVGYGLMKLDPGPPHDVLELQEFMNKGTVNGIPARQIFYNERNNVLNVSEPKSPYGLIDKGLAFDNQGKYDEAIEAYDKVIKYYERKTKPDTKNYALTWYNKGTALNNQGKYDEAIKAFDKAIKLNPKYATPWNSKGAALVQLGKYDEGLEAFDTTIKLDPKFEIAWYNKGNALADLGKYDEAIKAFDKAIKLNPKYATPWISKGAALVQLGKYDEAITCYDEAIRLDPSYALAWNNKGDALAKLNKYNEAIKAFDKAIKLKPNYALAWGNKAEALVDLNKNDEALKTSNMAIEFDPNLAYAWNIRGKALKACGRATESNVAFAKAKELKYVKSTIAERKKCFRGIEIVNFPKKR